MDRETAILNALNNDEQGEETVSEQEIPEYLDVLVHGVLAQEEEIDRTIARQLRNWSLNRRAKNDLLILRIGVYVLLYQQDVPANVVINEAIEITKEYSDEESRKFVNGVLSSVNRAQTKKEAE